MKYVVDSLQAYSCQHCILYNISLLYDLFLSKTFKLFQDKDLSEKVRKLAGVGLLYISHKAINLEAPSDASQQKADCKLTEKLGSGGREFHVLAALKKASFGEQPMKKRKKKSFKGPNPLSCKKKKPKPLEPSSQQNTTGEKRKRKRKHKKQTLHVNTVQ